MSAAYDMIFDRASEGRGLDRDDINALLSIEDTKTLERLFETANAVKIKRFRKRVFTYGFVYFSTFCRNNCSFCYYRRENRIERYRKPTDEIVRSSEDLEDSGVNLVDLTMGEDPVMHKNDHEKLIEIIE
ncbi:MAG: radical SAM protein, partial [Methanomassiliicoccaceae archaeon]|nr:radical SAM protein [Methanomassiliicoccaceae archaeon]